MRWTLRREIRAISDGSRGGLGGVGVGAVVVVVVVVVEGRSSVEEQGCGVEGTERPDFWAACAPAMRVIKKSRSSRARVVLPEQG